MLIYKKFESVSDFYKAEKGLSSNTLECFENKSDFLGVYSEKEAKEKMYTWKLAVKEINLNTPMSTSEYKKVHAFDDGDTMDYERYMEKSEMPYMIKRVKTKGKNNDKYCDIICNVSESSYIEASAMINKSKAVCSIVDSLETQNIRCQVIALMSAQDILKDCSDMVISVKIKDYSDSLNIGLIATCLSPWFLRAHMFSYVQNNFKNFRYNLGHPRPIRHFENEIKKLDKFYTSDFNIKIDKGECLNQQGIDNKIKEINKILENN